MDLDFIQTDLQTDMKSNWHCESSSLSSLGSGDMLLKLSKDLLDRPESEFFQPDETYPSHEVFDPQYTEDVNFHDPDYPTFGIPSDIPEYTSCQSSTNPSYYTCHQSSTKPSYYTCHQSSTKPSYFDTVETAMTTSMRGADESRRRRRSFFSSRRKSEATDALASKASQKSSAKSAIGSSKASQKSSAKSAIGSSKSSRWSSANDAAGSSKASHKPSVDAAVGSSKPPRKSYVNAAVGSSKPPRKSCVSAAVGSSEPPCESSPKSAVSSKACRQSSVNSVRFASDTAFKSSTPASPQNRSSSKNQHSVPTEGFDDFGLPITRAAASPTAYQRLSSFASSSADKKLKRKLNEQAKLVQKAEDADVTLKGLSVKREANQRRVSRVEGSHEDTVRKLQHHEEEQEHHLANKASKALRRAASLKEKDAAIVVHEGMSPGQLRSLMERKRRLQRGIQSAEADAQAYELRRNQSQMRLVEKTQRAEYKRSASVNRLTVDTEKLRIKEMRLQSKQADMRKRAAVKEQDIILIAGRV
ncbi:MAG: hypothetical protein KVP17_004487 [Porospora cf. gigantea B]|uniref:uncharacterized protein n=1 Tax=Porospora cf. gigantea B TaxID=2853592 RepID=UPI0035718A74|nr:MAG: hypothetical protein KVP17_004487 [Porospora cf. gigantea B]